MSNPIDNFFKKMEDDDREMIDTYSFTVKEKCPGACQACPKAEGQDLTKIKAQDTLKYLNPNNDDDWETFVKWFRMS